MQSQHWVRMTLNRHDSLCTWHDGFLAGGTLGGVIVGVAFSAQQQIIFGGKGLLHQRAAALGTLEALLMPVAILIRQILWAYNTSFVILTCKISN